MTTQKPRMQIIREKKLVIMRAANTEATSKYSLSGRLKNSGRSQKKVTLPKMPWEKSEK